MLLIGKIKKLFNIVSTCDTTLPGKPSRRIKHKKILNPETNKYEYIKYEKVINRPKLLTELHDSFPTIDIYDHLRQGSLNMEEG